MASFSRENVRFKSWKVTRDVYFMATNGKVLKTGQRFKDSHESAIGSHKDRFKICAG